MAEKCRTCANYGLFKMITSGRAYHYAGDIPCCRCDDWKWAGHSEYTPATKSVIKRLDEQTKEG